MSRILIIFAGIIAGLFLFVAAAVIFGPWLNMKAAEHRNARMRALCDRVRATPPDQEALQSLIQIMKSEDEFDGAKAAIALGNAGSHAEPAVDALAEALDGSNRYAAREATLALGKIGPA